MWRLPVVVFNIYYGMHVVSAFVQNVICGDADIAVAVK